MKVDCVEVIQISKAGKLLHQELPRASGTNRPLLPEWKIVFALQLLVDSQFWTPELDEFRSLFQLACRIRGKRLWYQGGEDHNTDNLL
jgi:hypothetical protein